ncbi:MAG: PVC-type heme-binding CxxCH protein [Gemmataceae bacterium]
MSRWLFLLAVLVCPLLAPAREETFPSPVQSVARMKVPEGFRVRLVAGEPTLLKPIAATTDERGRLWVIESHCYPHWIKDGRPGKDRVVILEPRGDGTWSSKVFLDNGVNLSGITVGFGGVWLASVPRIVFIPVKDDKPTGDPVVHLDGFSLDTKHNVVNSLLWGPDGWLYGLNGIQSQSKLGAPGTPAGKRVAMDCGVWRYHPVRKKVEAVAHGSTNPWGLDWDDFGEMFITNCVIKHAFHVVPGAHFVRMYGQDVNRHTYGLIESCADHIHWGGGNWTTSRGGQGAHSVAGGGHAHAGAMVYLGDNWPAEYRNRLFMGNIHGSRLNQDRLERSRSAYVIRHGEDFLFANDPWFRPLWMMAAHDGGMYVGDWHDTGECHNYDKTHPSGRVYHVAFGSPRRQAADLSRLSDADLVALQTHRDEWQVRQARRLLQERAVAGTLGKEVPALLEKALTGQSVAQKLRLLWAAHVVGALSEQRLHEHLDDAAPPVRVWAVRLLVDGDSVSEATARRLVEQSRKETDESVLLALTSALQRLSADQRWPLAEVLAARAASASDAYLPLMTWYGIESVVLAAPQRAASLARTAAIPLVRQLIARRLAESEEKPALAALTQLLAHADTSSAVRRDVLVGMGEALAGRRHVPAPPGWDVVYRSLATSDAAEVRERVLTLSVLFGDPQAMASLRRTVADGKAAPAVRHRSLEALLDRRIEGLPALLQQLLDDPAMRQPALLGLAGFDDPKTPQLLLARYAGWNEAEKAVAISTLASRRGYALALLDAIEKKTVARSDVSPFIARQIVALGDRTITDRLNTVWGSIRPPAKDREKLLARYIKLAAPKVREKADPVAGRVLYAKMCGNCHLLFGEGGKIGPDLTGSQRRNPEYILTKVLDPGAAVPRDYQLAKFVTVQGRVLTGVVKQENDKVIVVQTPTEEVRILKADLETREQAGGSLMPEGQLTPLTDDQVRDLLAYLAAEKQVPLKK